MKTRNQNLIIGGINVQLTRKRVKHLRLVVSPPDGRVRVSVPTSLSDATVWQFLEKKLGWIRDKQDRFAGYIKSVRPYYVTGEVHYYLGQPYRLQVTEQTGKPQVQQQGYALRMRVRPGSSVDVRSRVLDDWYRTELKRLVPELLEKWQPRVGESVRDWGIKKMKTRWGSCNINERRIWLNLELAKRPRQTIEYVLVHELVHLLERYHNDRFRTLMDGFMSDWRLHKQALRVDLIFTDALDN